MPAMLQVVQSGQSRCPGCTGKYLCCPPTQATHADGCGCHPDAAVQVQVQRKAVADEVTETQAAQIELDTTAEEFRNMHKERQGLLAQWDDTIQGMRR